MDLSAILGEVVPALHADSLGSLPFWQESELYEYSNRSLDRLARSAAVFPASNTISVTGGDGVYSLPDRTVSVAAASLDGRALWSATALELDAWRPAWQSQQGTVQRYTLDLGGLTEIRLALVPSANGVLGLVRASKPAAITPAAPTWTAPGPVEDFLSYAVLAEARAKESQGAMPEVARFAASMAELLIEAMQAAWGAAQ